MFIWFYMYSSITGLQILHRFISSYQSWPANQSAGPIHPPSHWGCLNDSSSCPSTWPILCRFIRVFLFLSVPDLCKWTRRWFHTTLCSLTSRRSWNIHELCVLWTLAARRLARDDAARKKKQKKNAVPLFDRSFKQMTCRTVEKHSIFKHLYRILWNFIENKCCSTLICGLPKTTVDFYIDKCGYY